MEQSAKQTLEFSKASLESSFEALTMIQNQVENATKTLIEQNQKISNQNQKSIDEWAAACKKGRDEFKKVVTANVKRFEELLGGWTDIYPSGK